MWRTALQNVLCNKNPWRKEGCGRHNCFVCGSGNPGGCQKEGILYSITCQECRSRGILACYWGEASRSGFLRGLDHQSLLKSKDDSSPLWKHSVEHHNAREDVVYSMKVERSHESPLNRQVDESTAIERSKAQIPMNSRSEWNSQRIPRIVVQVQGENELEDDEKLPTMETWTVHVPTVNVKQERRKCGTPEDVRESPLKRRRVGDRPSDDPEEDEEAPEAAGVHEGDKKLVPALGEGDNVGQRPRAAPAPMMEEYNVKNSLHSDLEVEEEKERPPLGEGDRAEQRPRAVIPLPMRSPKAKAIKKSSKGKFKSELRNKITNYFHLQDVKTSVELETRDSLSLSESADQGVVAGVGPKSNADGSSSE